MADNGETKTTGAELSPPIEDYKPRGPDDTDATLAAAIQYEHSLTFWEAVKLYPAAIGWSAFVSLGVIMLAFDPQLLGNFAAMNQFTSDFGYLFEGNYIISAPWLTGLSMGNPIGQVIGALVAGYPMDMFGRR